jgi:hypothetical protein
MCVPFWSAGRRTSILNVPTVPTAPAGVFSVSGYRTPFTPTRWITIWRVSTLDCTSGITKAGLMSFIYGFLQEADEGGAAILTVAAISQDFSTPRNECETTGPGWMGAPARSCEHKNGKAILRDIDSHVSARRESAYFMRIMPPCCRKMPFPLAQTNRRGVAAPVSVPRMTCVEGVRPRSPP